MPKWNEIKSNANKFRLLYHEYYSKTTNKPKTHKSLEVFKWTIKLSTASSTISIFNPHSKIHEKFSTLFGTPLIHISSFISSYILSYCINEWIVHWVRNFFDIPWLKKKKYAERKKKEENDGKNEDERSEL